MIPSESFPRQAASILQTSGVTSMLRATVLRNGFFDTATPKAVNTEQWRVRISSQPLTPPIVGNGFLVAWDMNDLIALDTATGRMLWKRNTKRAIYDDVQDHAPSVVGDTIVVSCDEGLLALEAETGSLRWQMAKSSAICSSPLVVADKVYVFAVDGTITCLDTGTGSMCWQSSAGCKLPSSSMHLAMNGGRLLAVSSRIGLVLAIDGTNGNAIWNACLNSEVKSLAITEDVVCIAYESASMAVLCLRPGTEPPVCASLSMGCRTTGPFTIIGRRIFITALDNLLAKDLSIEANQVGLTTAWHHASSYIGRPVAARDLVCLATAEGICGLNPTTGAVLWQRKVELPGADKPSDVTLDKERIFVTSFGGHVVALA